MLWFAFLCKTKNTTFVHHVFLVVVFLQWLINLWTWDPIYERGGGVAADSDEEDDDEEEDDEEEDDEDNEEDDL